MHTPAFFDAVPAITVADPLAETLGAAEHRVRVPMAGDVDSLNVATAFGVVAAFAASRAGWT